MNNDTAYSMDRLAAMLQDKGIRPSAQRIAVLAAVAATHSHPSADDIYTELSKVYTSLSRTTVYNSLRILAEKGLLRELEIDAGCLRYDMVREPHGHFVCRRCGRIFDAPMPPGMAAPALPQFMVDAVEITYRGLCPQCISNS